MSGLSKRKGSDPGLCFPASLTLISLLKLVEVGVICFIRPKCELCPLSWVALNGKCYYFSEERKNWSASREYCEQIKSKIISMEEDKEKVLISNQVPMRKGHFWIGLRKTDGHWYWETGGKLQKDIFSEVSGEHHCATFGNNLSSESCSNPNKWICKKKAYVFP
ncbi:hypothetical protein FKM82_014784 [Ascaphus truei]